MDTPHRALRNLNLQKPNTPLHIPASPHMKTLGYGTGVNVYKLEFSPRFGAMRSPLAVKRISKRAHEQKEIFNERIQHEAEVLRQLTHPNIVGFRGIQQSVDGINSLALECCTESLGCILEDARDKNEGPLAARYILRMINDVAQALDYLHNVAKYLHGDIKSYNILVKGDFEICKLCDFGVSLPLNDQGLIDLRETPNLNYMGTKLWMAPEILEDMPLIDCKADIFSFGLVIYETIALVPPHTLEMDKAAGNNDSCLSETDAEKTDVAEETALSLNEIETAAAQEIEVDKENQNEKNIEQATETTEQNEKEISTAINIENDAQTDDELDEDFCDFDLLCGTRPSLPQVFDLSEEYNTIVELFYLCTNKLPEDRPSAKTIYQIMRNNPDTSDNK